MRLKPSIEITSLLTIYDKNQEPHKYFLDEDQIDFILRYLEEKRKNK